MATSSASNFLAATALLVGTIVGAGIFALPAVSAVSGFPVALAWLVAVALIMALLHVMYGEVVMRTAGAHRLPGYALRYLGIAAERWAFLSALFGSIGGLLIYIVLADLFFSDLFPGVFVRGEWGILAWALLVLLVTLGLKAIARVELLMAVFLVLFILLIAAAALPRFSFSHISFLGDLSDAALPFGVMLFALGGFNAIPEMRGFFGEHDRRYRRAILLGSLIPALLYVVFITAIVGAFGEGAAADITDVVANLGDFFLRALAVFGLLAVATSFLVVGVYLVDTLRYDFRWRRSTALAVLVTPALFFLAGARDFVPLVVIVGTVLGAVDGTLIVLIWRRARTRGTLSPPFSVRLPTAAAYGIIALFVIGTVMVLFSLLT